MSVEQPEPDWKQDMRDDFDGPILKSMRDDPASSLEVRRSAEAMLRRMVEARRKRRERKP